MKALIATFIFVFVMGFTFQNPRPMSKHIVVPNSDMVISLRLDKLTSDNIIIYTSHTSLDTTSPLLKHLPVAFKHMMENGTMTTKFIDGEKDTIILKKGRKL